MRLHTSMSSFHCVTLALAVLLRPISVIAQEQDRTSGCGTPHRSELGQAIDTSIQSNNGSNSIGTRRFLVYLPSGYNPDSPAPLIVSYHGQGKTRQYQKDLDDFSDESINPNMIVVYPQALKDSNEHVSAYLPSQFSHHPQDLLYTIFTSQPSCLTKIVARVGRRPVCETWRQRQDFHYRPSKSRESKYCIDTQRIYATGKSIGGGFVDLLACSPTHGGDFAAFAPVAGAFYSVVDGSACHPARSSLPMLEFHGSSDREIPYEGGDEKNGKVPAIPDWLSRWAVRNGCPDPPKSTTIDHNNNTKATTYSYVEDSCNGHTDIMRHYKVEGMGHVWPSTTNNSDNNGKTTWIDATPLIVDFFKSNCKPGAILREAGGEHLQQLVQKPT